MLLSAMCTGVRIAVSLTTPAQTTERLAGPTLATVDRGGAGSVEEPRSSVRRRRPDVVLSVLLILAVTLVWPGFRG